MNIDQDNNTIRKRSLSQSSNSSNSKRSCSVDSPSPIDNNNNSTTSNNLINSISSLGCSNLNLMEDLNDDKKQLEFEESVLKTTTSSSSTTTSATTIDSDSISPTPEQIDDDELNTTIMASSTTSSIEKDLADYESSLPSYASLASITTTSSKPDGTTQIQIIDELKNEQLATGDTWYLVSREWYRKWETACSGIAESKEDDTGLSMDDIGPVDNARLTDQHGELKRNMIDGVTVTVLPRACWELLCSWYGYSGSTFPRQIVSTEAYNSERVEFYPPSFQFQQLLPSIPSAGSGPPPPVISLSSGCKLKELKAEAIMVFQLDPLAPIRFWRLNENSLAETDNLLVEKLAEEGGELVQKDGITDESLLSASLLDNQLNRLAVEQQVGGKWLVDDSQLASTDAPKAEGEKKATLFGGKNFFGSMEQKNAKTNILQARNKSATASTSKAVSIAVPSNSTNSGGGFMRTLTGALTRSQSSSKSGGQKGLTGLQNLGNTCFMNSALQCMSNTKELQEYFTSGVYKSELNRDNPLGMNGQVAEAFGQLIERLWSTSGSSVAPREFKQALSKFAPSFSGYGQQDSQELLAFLLDGTHEDLNRIKIKPGTNAPDWVMGGGDKELVELARTCWEQYRSRNDSVIVDLFQGQYRSTVVCPDCSKVSITFDPFMYVTTNLPVMKKWTGDLTFVPLDTSKRPVVISLELPKTVTLKAAKMAIGNFMGVDGKTLLITEAWKGKFWRMWYDDELVTEMQANDAIYVFETTATVSQPKPRTYGKTKPIIAPVATDEDVPIIVAVSGYCSGDKPKKFSLSSGDYVGHPFLLSLTKAQASSYEGIEKALREQYSRYTSRVEEMLGEEAKEEDVNMNETSVVPPPTQDSALSVPLPLTAPTTPTHESMDIDDQSTSLPSPPPEQPTTIDPSLLTSSEAPKPKVPFTIKVASRPKAGGAYPFESKDCPEGDYAVDLKSRVIPNLFNKTLSTAIPIAIPSSAPTPTEESPNAIPVESSSIPSVPIPLVVTGDYIIADWSPAAARYFFNDETSRFSNVDSFVDPAITAAKERLAAGGKKQSITIEDCLREFTKEERLGEDDTWYCPDCKKHQQATKKVEIWKVPDVLVFNLKRFSASRYSRDKIDDLVSFPIKEFNMEPFVEGDKVEKRLAATGGVVVEEAESLIYDLYAVDNHYGGMGGGHYTAYAKNHENGKWYDFDDSRVSEIAESRIQTSAAYLLFYRRRTARPIGAKSRELVDSALQSALQSRVASTSVSRGVSPSASNQHSRASSVDGAAGGFLKHDQSSFIRSRMEDENFMSMTSRSGSDKAENGSFRSSSPYQDASMDNIDPTIDFEVPFMDRAGYYDDEEAVNVIVPDVDKDYLKVDYNGEVTEVSNDLESIE